MFKERNLDFASNLEIFKSIFQGVEKEGLRVNTKLELSKLPHPLGLGSKLTHPFITTDYSENLLEYITSVYTNTDELLLSLQKMHCFTYHRLEQDEIIWPWSMPAIVPENEMDIPVAHYGTSNIGKLKELYRVGLGHRYGKSMQSIAGVHYNFSLSSEFWEKYKELTEDDRDLQSVINDGYFHLIRNYRRYSWLLIYLFGSSPVVDESFLKNKKHDLEKIGLNTWGRPFGTSLRMGGLGYTSNAQNEISICYNKLDTYIQTLELARQRSYPTYEAIGLKENGEYKQLNTNLLQIDNEFYSTIRPKNVARSNESALQALHKRGIEYIEVRLLDVNPFIDTGIDKDTVLFLHTFLISCLLNESPLIGKNECSELETNFNRVVNQGRKPGLTLLDNNQESELTDFASSLFEKMEKTLSYLEKVHPNENYRTAFDKQKKKIFDISELPSDKVYKMCSNEKSILELIGEKGKQFKREHIEMGLKHDLEIEWNKFAHDSILKQKQIEENDKLNFDQFLEEYFEKIKIKCEG